MDQKRAIIVRIAGVGFAVDWQKPLTLTSRTVSYLQHTALQGVVTDLTAQFSSEIQLFGTMGSDPTTTFSVLANAQTLAALMGRGSAPLRGADNRTVQTTDYIVPSYFPALYVTDTSSVAPGDIVRINGLSYYVNNVLSGNILACDMAYGSVPQPIPMRVLGNEVFGSTVYMSYAMGQEHATGGIEQLAVTISTVHIDAPDETHEEVVFRGIVAKVNIQTSAGTDNQIRVECGSLMGVLKNAPWQPTQGSLTFYGAPNRSRPTDGDRPNPDNPDGSGGGFYFTLARNLVGPLYEWTAQGYDTRICTVQVRKEKFGGVSSVQYMQTPHQPFISARAVDPTLDDLRASGFNLYFNDGYYRESRGSGDDLDVALTDSGRSQYNDAQRRRGGIRGDSVITASIEPEYVGEICFSSDNLINLFIDLLFGTFDSQLGLQGARAWGMAAYMPFHPFLFAEIMDLGSLVQALDNANTLRDLPVMLGYDMTTNANMPNRVVLPVKPDGPKTIGEVLEFVLKNLGIFMVYDRGKLVFGRWSASTPWPIEVNDSDFAEPKIQLTFDRQNSVQVAEVNYPAVISQDTLDLTTNPVANVERIMNGGGKTVTVASMMAHGTDYQAGMIASQAFITGTNTILRYSEAAGIVEVTLRNETKFLQVGSSIALTTQFIPNGQGAMGVVNATGIVIKAVRSWQTPTSSYTLFMPGYLYAANRVSMVAASGRVVAVIAPDVVQIEMNDFTSPVPMPGQPATDAAAFQQTLDRVPVGSDLYVTLCDEYGTYKSGEKLLSVSGADQLVLVGSGFSSALAGDIITIAAAGGYGPSFMNACWDAFQADVGGAVNSDTAYAYPWVR